MAINHESLQNCVSRSQDIFLSLCPSDRVRRVLEPVLHDRSSHQPLERFNQLGTLAHGVRAQIMFDYLRLSVASELANDPNNQPAAEIVYNLSGNLLLHDLHKMHMHSDPESAAILRDPERHGVTKPRDIHDSIDTRPPWLRKYSLHHPHGSYLMIYDLIGLGNLDAELGARYAHAAISHHEGKYLTDFSYPRNTYRPKDHESNLLLRLSDIITGMLLEKRGYRNADIPDENASVILNNHLSHRTMKDLAVRIHLHEPTFSIGYLRGIMIKTAINARAMFGVADPDQGLAELGIPVHARKSKFNISNYSGRFWDKFGDNIATRNNGIRIHKINLPL